MNIPSIKKKDKTLIIKGISINDLIDPESVMEERLLRNINSGQESFEFININEEIKLDNLALEECTDFDLYKIPGRFTTLDKWPKRTKIHCWYCDNNIYKIPIFIPKSMDIDNKGNLSMKTYGCFCSFSCAYTHSQIILENINDKLSSEKLLIKLFEIFFNKKIKFLIRSPNKYLMKRYGGSLTINEYLKLIRNNEKKYI